MPRTRTPYSLEFRQQILELVRTGRTPNELASEFEPSGETIRQWVKQAELDAGERQDGLTTDEKAEIAQLRREVKRLKQEQEILKNRCLVRSRNGPRSAEIFQFIKANRSDYPIQTMCRVLEVSRSGSYAWLKRPPSQRTKEDEKLTNRIRTIYNPFQEHLWGSPYPC